MENENFTPVFEVNNKRRKRGIRAYRTIIIIILIASLGVLYYYLNSVKPEYYDYSEKSNVDYKVYLKRNEFFKEKYLEKDQKYIASLIETIKAKFDYNIQLKEDVGSFYYAYDIESVVDVKDKSDKKTIYTNSKKIVEKKSSTNNSKNVDISEEFDINYHQYNDLINKFVNVYELNDANCSLLVTMYVKIAKTEEELAKAESKNVASLEIPLTTKTVGVELVTVTSDKTNNKTFLKEKVGNLYILYAAYAIFVVDLAILAFALRYASDTKTEEVIFDKKLNRILHTYKGYIQKADLTKFSYRGYQSVYVEKFSDLLEIRDTLQAPILLLQNREEREVRFLIPSENKIIYIFWLGTDTAKKRLTAGTNKKTTKKTTKKSTKKSTKKAEEIKEDEYEETILDDYEDKKEDEYEEIILDDYEDKKEDEYEEIILDDYDDKEESEENNYEVEEIKPKKTTTRRRRTTTKNKTKDI